MVSIIYDNYIDIFQKMVLIKNKKSIKTWFEYLTFIMHKLSKMNEMITRFTSIFIFEKRETIIKNINKMTEE